MADGVPALRPGEVLSLPDDDYRYGVGPIVAHVVRIVGKVPYHGEPWWMVEAEVAEGTPDSHGSWNRRELYVREETLPRTRREPRT